MRIATIVRIKDRIRRRVSIAVVAVPPDVQTVQGYMAKLSTIHMKP